MTTTTLFDTTPQAAPEPYACSLVSALSLLAGIPLWIVLTFTFVRGWDVIAYLFYGVIAMVIASVGFAIFAFLRRERAWPASLILSMTAAVPLMAIFLR